MEVLKGGVEGASDQDQAGDFVGVFGREAAGDGGAEGVGDQDRVLAIAGDEEGGDGRGLVVEGTDGAGSAGVALAEAVDGDGPEAGDGVVQESGPGGGFAGCAVDVDEARGGGVARGEV